MNHPIDAAAYAPQTLEQSDHAVCSLKEALQPDEATRWVAAGQDMNYPPVPFPPLVVLRTAGEPLLRAVVRRHHELLRQSPQLGRMFPQDEAVFTRVVERIADFVVEACGGPTAYTGGQDYTCIRTRHFPFTIDEAAREAWLAALWQSLEVLQFPLAVREPYWAWLEAMSIRMINRRTTKAQPRRYPCPAMPGAMG